MTDLVTTSESKELDYITGNEGKDVENFVTFIIEDQMFGIPVLGVQDILTPDAIASVPLAPPEVKGSINLRGRIVTVVDVRVRLGLGGRPVDLNNMGVTVEHQNELYTLLVDTVGDVIGLSSEYFENNPGTLDPLWRDFANGVYRLDDRLMVVLDVGHLLNLTEQ
ncbi:MAG: chemotaxis protein CheW [Rhodospirillales bacterium]|mgnify:CR=1 FL=1|jgi:purine-binding chemotaxis protein CheW|nr:chemotaxis protein CheW [Rhodospirillales bacterium]MDP6788553.1 chemotaxis protein CheW [Rhodospirillales bacterium]